MMDARTTLDAVKTPLAALGPVREGVAADGIDGVVPGLVIEPTSALAVASALACASSAGLATVIRGGGTKIGWGRVPPRVDLTVSMASLSRVVSHRHGDLIAIVDAGARVAQINAELSRHGQWLPIDSPFPDATVGGILATNASGAARHRYGTPRDLLIGVRLAMTDGRVVKAGGEVVKNVAGYDLGKLVCGSHGTFGAIVSATFKLVPQPLSTQTLLGRFSPDAAARAVAVLGASQWEPMACDLRLDSARPGVELLVRFGSTASAVDAQVRDVRAAWTEATELDVVTGEREAALWRQHELEPWTGDATVLRLGWLPASAPALFDVLAAVASADGVSVTVTGRAGVGAGFARMVGPEAAQLRAIARLRGGTPSLQHVAVLRASPTLKSQVDVWPPAGSAAGALQALKRNFDPANVLNAGRGPI